MRLLASWAAFALALLVLLPCGRGGEEEPDRSLARRPGAPRRIAVDKRFDAGPTSRVVRGTLGASGLSLRDGSRAEAWLWHGSQGQHLEIEMRSEELEPILILVQDLGEDVRQIATAGGDTAARVEARLPETADYFVVATSTAAGARGHYELRLSASPPDTRAAAAVRIAEGTEGIGIGARLTSRITADDTTLADGSRTDVWTFAARAGQVVTLRMSSPDFEPWVGFALLRGEQPGEFLVQDVAREGRRDVTLSVELPATATYLVCAGTSLPGSTGEYTVRLSEDRPHGTSLDDLESRYPGNGDPADTYALLVGIDNYPGVEHDLNSCVADVQLWRRLLIEQYGLKPENVVTITDADATAEHVVTAFARHLGQAGPQGAAVFVYSGHGVQLDRNVDPQDAEDDGMDEAIALWAAPPRGSLVTDDVLGDLIASLAAERVVVVMDSCSSGTGTRGPKDRVKEMKYKDVKETYDLFDGSRRSGLSASDANADRQPSRHVLLAGCKSNETSMAWPGEPWPDVGVASVFTYFLISCLRNAVGATSFEQALAQVRPRVQNFAQNLRGAPQTPQVEGEDAARSVADYLRRR